MKRRFSLAIEGEPGAYSAYVPELPAILITGRTIEDLCLRAQEAIRLYFQAIMAEVSPASMVREIEVDLPD